ncbi:MAG: type II secretion system F family protein [Acidimicrobiales bacterium]
MLGPLLTVAWPLAFLAAGWRFRPRSRPVFDPARTDLGRTDLGRTDLGRTDTAPSGDRADTDSAETTRSGGGRGWRLLGPVVQPAGRLVRSLARRPPDELADRRAGLALVGAAALLAVNPVLAPLVPVAWWSVPRLRRRRHLRADDGAVQDELPLAADLFVLAAGAGLTVPLAVSAIAPRATGPLGVALREADRRTHLGQHPADALGVVVERVGESARPLIAVLISAERYGTALVGPLERVADELRRQRRRHAEEAARRVPVKLLFPLVLCTLPAFALLTVVPLLVSALGGLGI